MNISKPKTILFISFKYSINYLIGTADIYAGLRIIGATQALINSQR
jgi:hypothetical protein